MGDAWIYVSLVGACVAVYFALKPRAKQPSAEQQAINEMEIAFEQFIINSDDENKKLVDLVIKLNEESQLKTKRLEERIQLLEQRMAQLEAVQLQQQSAPSRKSQKSKTTVQQNVVQDVPPVVVKQEEPPQPPVNTIRSRYVDLFEYYDKGKSIEWISKKLGKHKGEVQLILQLAKQEDVSIRG